MSNTDVTIETWIMPVTNTPGTIWSRSGYIGGIEAHINTSSTPCISTGSLAIHFKQYNNS